MADRHFGRHFPSPHFPSPHFAAGGPDVTAPILVHATLNQARDEISLVFNEAVQFGAGGNGGVSVNPSGGAATATYDSGSGTGILVYSLSRALAASETLTVSYVQPTDGIEDAAGNDAASFGPTAVGLPGITTIDARYNSLRSQYPAGPATVTDLMLLWLAGEGGTGNTASDLWRSMLLSKGATPGTVNDMWFEVLGDNGFTQGTLTDREQAFWASGGNLA